MEKSLRLQLDSRRKLAIVGIALGVAVILGALLHPQSHFAYTEVGGVASRFFRDATIPVDLFGEARRTGVLTPFKFHVYAQDAAFSTDVATKYPYFFANTTSKKQYRSEWMIAQDLRRHPFHTDDPEEAEIFIVPAMESFWRFASREGHVDGHKAMTGTFEAAKQAGDYWKRFNGHDHYVVNNWYRNFNDRIPNINYFTTQIKSAGKPECCIRYEFHENYRKLSNHIIVPQWVSRSMQKHIKVHDRQYFAIFVGSTSVNSHKASRVRGLIKEKMDEVNSEDVRFFQLGHRTELGGQLEHTFEDYMANSTFCPGSPGDVDIAARVYTAIVNGCIPVMFCDWCAYAFENFVDYSKFSYFFVEGQLFNKSWNFVNELRKIPAEEIREKQRNLENVRRLFEWDSDPATGALNTIVRQLELEADNLRRFRRWFRWRNDYPQWDNRTGYKDGVFNEW